MARARRRPPVTAGSGPADAQAAADALGRARQFVARLADLRLDEWREVLQRVRAVDAAAHRAALRRAAELLAAHPDAATMRALQDAACAAAPTEAAAGPGTGPSCGLAGRVAAHAAFALALGDALTPGEFAALYAPFARPTPPGGDAGGTRDGGAERRTAVPALPAVAAPLAAAPATAGSPPPDPVADPASRPAPDRSAGAERRAGRAGGRDDPGQAERRTR